MIKHIKVIKDKGSVWDSVIKVDVKHEFDNRIAIEFLSPTTFCGIGYYKWYFKDEFLKVFQFIDIT